MGCTPFPAEVARSYRAAGYWRDETVWEALAASIERRPDKLALVGGDTRLTYAQLGREVERLSERVLALGIGRGDRVLVQLPNIPEFLVLYLALARIGAIPVTALPPHRRTEILYLAEHSGAVAYVIPATYRGFDYRELGEEVRRSVATVKHVLVVGDSGFDLGGQPAPAGAETARPDPAEPVVFLLSGGTTGLPKLIPRTHQDYLYNSRRANDVCGVTEDDVFLAAAPIAHNFPLACPGAQGVFLAGGTVVLSTTTEPEELFQLIERERVTFTAAVPAMAIGWLNSPARARYDLSSLRLIITGGSKFNPEPASRVRPELGCQLQQVLGMAEGLLCYTRLDDPDEVVWETVGRPMSPADEVRVVDDDGDDVPDGQPGELWTRGPYTIRGYYRAEEHNALAFTRQGFYKTGDVVLRRPDGNLVVEGRKKDMVNRGGEKISAEEVENLILGHPAVELAAVVAMPDPVLGERPCAYVTLKDGGSLTFEQLIEYLKGQEIARFKLPERLEVLSHMPLTSVGKIAKAELRADIARRVGPAGV
jgi:2,3-dihydroxybenzoate-AMP ligase